MEAVAFSRSIVAASSFSSHRPQLGVSSLSPRRRAIGSGPASAKKDTHGPDFGGGLVDQDMIVLRKRIHDMEVAERNYEPPRHWAEWEKRCYATYGADVCAFAGLVQTLLMSTRPGVAIGLAGLVAMSVPASAALILVHLAEIVKAGALGG